MLHFRFQCFFYLLILFFAGSARAHKVTTVSVVTDIDTKKQTYAVNLAMEVESSGDAEADEQISPEQAARNFTQEALVIYFDKAEVKEHDVKSEIITTSDEDTPEELKRMTATVILSGKIPEGSENFLLYVDESTEASVVMVYRKDGKPSRRMQVLYPGDFSRPNNILPIETGDPFEKAEEEKIAATNEKLGVLDSSSAPNGVKTLGFMDNLKNGIATVFPNGTVHWVFVIGFLLLNLRMRPITVQVGAFVIAHSLGLALSVFEIATVAESISLVIVGLGVLYVGLENLIFTTLKPWRPVAIFVVGLFHGFMFSTHYSGRGISDLIGFNFGIEIAIIAILMVGLIVLNILFKQEWYRNVIVLPASGLLVAAGLYWACLPFLK